MREFRRWRQALVQSPSALPNGRGLQNSCDRLVVAHFPFIFLARIGAIDRDSAQQLRPGEILDWAWIIWLHSHHSRVTTYLMACHCQFQSNRELQAYGSDTECTSASARRDCTGWGNELSRRIQDWCRGWPLSSLYPGKNEAETVQFSALQDCFVF